MKSTPHHIIKVLTRQKSQIRLQRVQQLPKTWTANQRCSRSLVNLLRAYIIEAGFSTKKWRF